MAKAKHKPYLFELRTQEVDGKEEWQFKGPDCKDWMKISKEQFNGTQEVHSDSGKPKKINFKRLTKVSRRVKYELEN